MSADKTNDDSDGAPPWVASLRAIGLPTLLATSGVILSVFAILGEVSSQVFTVSATEVWQRVTLGVFGVLLMTTGVFLYATHSRRRRVMASEARDRQDAQSISHLFHTLDETESIEAAFAGCTQIDFLLRTGANVVGRYSNLIIDAIRNGAYVRILLLNPASTAAQTVYGPDPAAYTRNAAQLPGWLKRIERRTRRRAKTGRLQIRKTDFLPPFSMFIVHKKTPGNSFARTQINFTHTAIGGDRPTFRLNQGDRWYTVFEREYREAWRAGTRTTADELQRIIDKAAGSEHIGDIANIFPKQDRETCVFDEPSTVARAYFQTKHTLVIPNKAPIVKGHSLVIPRRHVERLEDLTHDEVLDLFETARSVSDQLMHAPHVSGMNWALQDGTSAGQTVPHFHLHIMPRSDGDLPTPGEWFGHLPGGEPVVRAIDEPGRRALSEQELDEEAAELRRRFEE